MLVIYPFSVVDQEQALKNARWISELGDCKTHDILVLCDRRCDPEIMRQVVQCFGTVFRFVKHRLTKSDIDGWPQGANQLFSYACTLIQHEQEWPYFLWLEPDAIPIRPGWLDALESEYRCAGKPFMGELVDLGEKRPDVPKHMSGVGFYQNPIYLLAGECYRAHEVAWDIAAKDQIIPHAHFTKLIQHYWKHGTFTSLDGLRPETMIFHSSKDGSLIDLLRKKAAPEKESHSVPTEPTTRETPSREEIGTRAAQPIKVLPHNGAWVLAGDTIISDQVEREGRLDFDPLIPHIAPLIRPGDTVVDVGAFIGDHTVAYSHAVGPKGKVFAYEPNPDAFKCLVHNTNGMGNVFGFCHGLGRSDGIAGLVGSYASSYISHNNAEQGPIIQVRRLDNDLPLLTQLDFMKIDVEGYELNVLEGAEQLIEKFHPVMVVEINPEALGRQRTTPEDVVGWMVRHGYQVSVLYRHPESPFYDILCVPQKSPEASQGSELVHTPRPSDPSPAAYRPTVKEEIQWHVEVLKQLCESSPQTKAVVMQKLVYAGLRPPNKKKKYAKSKTNKHTNGQRRPTAEEYTA